MADLGSHAITVTDELGVSEVQPLALSVEDANFASVLPGGNQFDDAMLALQSNSPRLLRSIIQNSNNQRFVNALSALKQRDSKLLVFMPTPKMGINPLLVLPTGLKLKAGPVKAKVNLYFGHKRMTGRFIGIGVSDANIKRPHQFFRMDWHEPHAGRSSKNEVDYWNSGIGNFHFHVLAKR